MQFLIDLLEKCKTQLGYISDTDSYTGHSKSQKSPINKRYEASGFTLFLIFLYCVLDLEMKMLNIKENKRITIKGYELKMVDKNVTMKVHVNR